jgi:hypothetical protein
MDRSRDEGRRVGRVCRVGRVGRLLLVALLGPGLACSGGAVASRGSDPDFSPDARDAALAYARCLREHGMDVADPAAGGADGQTGAAAVGDPSDATEQAAAAACAALLPAVGTQGARTADDEEAMREAMVAFARCLREHGIDQPDPRFLPGGGIDLGPAPAADGPTLENARRACAHHGGFGTGDEGPVLSGRHDG